MNPQLDNTPGLGLPQPSFGMEQPATASTPQSFRAPESAPPAFMTPQPMVVEPQNQPPQPQAQIQPQPLAPQPAIQPQAQPMQPVSAAAMQDVSVALQNDDNETALDEEWIAKARETVEKTHTDPYLQSKEISRIKAQYIKARYNKDIKLVEE